eukprot:2073518-Alexandrium_andersonii.AAC.1
MGVGEGLRVFTGRQADCRRGQPRGRGLQGQVGSPWAALPSWPAARSGNDFPVSEASSSP